jgi:predicted RNase H-like HicB family nuclease
LCARDNGRKTHHIAIVEEEEDKAFGVWFPDLPGCISAGDTLDEAMLNAAEALELWAEAMIESGQKIPAARSLTELKADSGIAQELASYMVALIPFPQGLHQHAAE